MGQEKCSLNWNNFETCAGKTLKGLLSDETFTDVTLACDDGKQIKAHKVILGASSPVMKNILKSNAHPSPFIYLKGVHYEDIRNMVRFIYTGETEVMQEDVDRFLMLTEEFEVSGLYVGKMKKALSPNLQDTDTAQNTQENLSTIVNRHEDEVTIDDAFNELEKVQENINHELSKTESKVKNESVKTVNLHHESLSVVKSNAKEAGGFWCPVCDTVFKSNQNLNRHTRTKHEGERHGCDECGYLATQMASLKRHKMTQHSN